MNNRSRRNAGRATNNGSGTDIPLLSGMPSLTIINDDLLPISEPIRGRRQVEEQLQNIPVIHNSGITDSDYEKANPKKHDENAPKFYELGLEKRRELSERRKKEFLRGLVLCRGFIGKTLKLSGVSRSTYEMWRKRDAKFLSNVQDIQAEVDDEVEIALMEKIREGDTQAILFYARTKLRYRGYTEKEQIIVTNQQNVAGKPQG